MMTLDHAFWTYFFTRRKKRTTVWFVLGSVSPDLIYFLAFLYMAAQKAILDPELIGNVIKLAISGYSQDVLSREAFESINQLVSQVFSHPFVRHVRYSNHSLLLWGFIFASTLFTAKRKNAPWKAFLIGWGGHVLIDLLTHVTDAAPPFYPLSSMVIPGLVSYWNPAYHGEAFYRWNLMLTVLALLYLIFAKLKETVIQRYLRKKQWN